MNQPTRTPQVGDYVLVSSLPESWEGSGEPDEDRQALVGHVGVVVEVTEYDAFVCFPGLKDAVMVAQRNIEFEALTVISSPAAPLPDSVYA